METIDFIEFKRTSYKAQLQELYRKLDATVLPFELGTIARYEFSRSARGQFISALSLKKQVPIEEIAKILDTSVADVHKTFAGKQSISDGVFFKLCARLGADNEISVFIEKLEEALIPQLREGRKEMASALKLHGYVFADEEPS